MHRPTYIYKYTYIHTYIHTYLHTYIYIYIYIIYIYINIKGGVSDFWLYVRKRGGGHSDAYCVQQGGWGGLKIGKKCVCN